MAGGVHELAMHESKNSRTLLTLLEKQKTEISSFGGEKSGAVTKNSFMQSYKHSIHILLGHYADITLYKL